MNRSHALVSIVRLIFFSLVLLANDMFGAERFTVAEKNALVLELKEEFKEMRGKNGGKIDLNLLRSSLYEELDGLIDREKLSADEAVKIKQNYESFLKGLSVPADKLENVYVQFMIGELEKVSQLKVNQVGEGSICNLALCQKGLSCAPDPHQKMAGRSGETGMRCRENSECLSFSCVPDEDVKNLKVCEEVYRCYRPLRLGDNCSQNPICGNGKCLPFNLQTSSIGECFSNRVSCKQNSDCCSNLCQGGVCMENKICKDCRPSGSRPERGQVCCEGLYLNEKGICVPDVPPSVIPQVRNREMLIPKLMIYALMIFSEQVYAEETVNPKQSIKDANTKIHQEVKVDKELYTNFKPKSDKAQAVDIKKVKSEMGFLNKKTDFNTCDIFFKEDYYNELKKKETFDLEVALTAFDFVMLGQADQDYWRSHSSEASSLYGRLRAVAEENKKNRELRNKNIEEINNKLTCLCLDAKGYTNITDQGKKTFFETKCEEFKNISSQTVSQTDINYSQLSGDASGLKAKMLLTVWTEKMDDFYMSLTVQNEGVWNSLSEILTWATEEAKWNDARHREYELFKFNIKNANYGVAALGAFASALLAAGVIAVLGGFAATSLLSAWGAVGIIAASAVTGAGGVWLVASLKGAWITKYPEIVDSNPRGYSCGKSESCTEYTRVLRQPYNDVCKVHTSANSCIVNFVAVNDDGETVFIVDPWVPVGVEKNAILPSLGSEDYAHKLERGFEAAKLEMMNRNPGAGGGGGKKGGGQFVSESYLTDIFIDAEIVGRYAPMLGSDPEIGHRLRDEQVRLIKEAAIKFIKDEKFVDANDNENANKFAEYAYKYHFLWPKKSSPNEISYPPPGLLTYLSFIANEVTGTLAASNGNSRKELGNLRSQYLEDFKNTLELYKDNNPTQAEAIKKEITKVGQALEELKNFNAMVDSIGLSGQLAKGGLVGLSGQSSLSGGGSFGNASGQFANAIGRMRKARGNQARALNHYKKEMKNQGNENRLNKMLAASEKAKKQFGSPFNKVSGLGSSLFGAPSNNANLNGNVGYNPKEENSAQFDQGLGGTIGGESGAGGNPLYGWGQSGASSSGSKSSFDQANQNKLSEAIEERNKADQEKYSSENGNTIFDKVTNAYIRNYDRLLMEKPQTEKPEKK